MNNWAIQDGYLYYVHPDSYTHYVRIMFRTEGYEVVEVEDGIETRHKTHRDLVVAIVHAEGWLYS